MGCSYSSATELHMYGLCMASSEKFVTCHYMMAESVSSTSQL
jgi:hypothetical protein